MPKWPEMTERFAEVSKTKTLDQWAAIFEGKDVYSQALPNTGQGYRGKGPERCKYRRDFD